jgi:hypothetical protein
VQEGELSGRLGVVELDRLVACIVDQGVGNAERRDKVSSRRLPARSMVASMA